jgi:hypothetical protein
LRQARFIVLIELIGFLVIGFLSDLWLFCLCFLSFCLHRLLHNLNVADAIHSKVISLSFFGHADNFATGSCREIGKILLLCSLILDIALSILRVISPHLDPLSGLLVGGDGSHLPQGTLRRDLLTAGERLAHVDRRVIPVILRRVLFTLLHEHLQIAEAWRLLSTVYHVLPFFSADCVAKVLFSFSVLII